MSAAAPPRVVTTRGDEWLRLARLTRKLSWLSSPGMLCVAVGIDARRPKLRRKRG